MSSQTAITFKNGDKWFYLEQLARICNRQLFAARFLTVDADIEHDEGVLSFYKKNGFILNAEPHKKNRKTVSMRRDIYLT
jgi:hypothetical protein